MENRELYGQLTRRMKKLPITDDVIDSVMRIRIPVFDNEENKLIQYFQQELLRVSKRKNNSNEVGCLISMSDWSPRFILGNENSITLADDSVCYRKVKESPKNSLIFMHNHPRNTIFSETDLRSFFKADSIWIMTVICNNGRIHMLMKDSFFQPVSAEIEYNRQVVLQSDTSAVKRFLRTCRKWGLHYKYGGNIK